MKKSDISERRSVGDVTSISTGTTAQSGVSDGKAGMVAAPETSGNPSGDMSGGAIGTSSNPSLAGLPVGSNKGFAPPDLVQPDQGTTKEADSVQTSPDGRSVSWPAAANMTDGAKMTTTWMEKTGSKVAFPAAANKTSGVKEVSSFIGPK